MFPIKSTVPTRYPAVVVWTLIVINCAVFLIQLGMSPEEFQAFMYNFGMVPARYFGPGRGVLTPADFVPFITLMFLHGSWLHLVLNMWMLWLFGSPVEDRLGSVRFVIFYIACGILAALTDAAFRPTSEIPAIGASGAIAGVMGCHLRLFPHARFIVLVLIVFIPLFIEMPAVVFMAIWFAIQLMQATVALLVLPSIGEAAGIAWWAHIGGFVAGLLLAHLLAQPKRLRRDYFDDEGVLGFDRTGR